MSFNFEKLVVYNKSIILAKEIYELTGKYPDKEQFGLTGQFCRAAVSVSLNIAEGSGRSKKDFRHFLIIAKTSVQECIPLLEI